jgi:hypothetical protein
VAVESLPLKQVKPKKGKPMSKKKIVETAELVEQKQALALKASQGDNKAREEWKAINQLIAEREQDVQLAQDAEREAERLAIEAELARLASEQREKEKILAECQAEYEAALQKVQDATELLIAPVEEALQAAGLVSSAAVEANKRIGRVKGKADVARYLREKMTCLWPELGDFVRPLGRGPLVSAEVQADDDEQEPVIELLPDPFPSTSSGERIEVAG